MNEFKRLWCVVLLSILTGASVQAQEYPTRPITLIVPLAPGGPVDIQTRVLAKFMQDKLKVSVLVENRPGAQTVLGASRVAQATPDGYTLGQLVLTQYSRVLNKDGPQDVTQVFDLIAPGWIGPFVMAVNTLDSKAKTLQEFITYARANQGKLNYANNAVTNQLAMESFNRLAGLKIVKIDYKGNSQASAALLANEVQVYMGLLGGAAANVATGKVFILGVADDKRIPGAPTIPTMTEAGLPLKAYLTGAYYGPAGLPKAVLAKLEPIVREAVVSTEMERVTLQQVGRGLTVSNAEYLRMLREEIDFWAGAAKNENYKPE